MFSHKRHADLKLECAYCHTTAETAERAGFPSVSKCMLCHQQVAKDNPVIQLLAALGKDAAPFPTRRVYELPDFVFFSHARHRKAKIDCQKCHGPVLARDVLTREFPMTMKACVDCHRANGATLRCNACHELK